VFTSFIEDKNSEVTLVLFQLMVIMDTKGCSGITGW
jgi:hypothetical protein